jgi:hypothetical protein
MISRPISEVLPVRIKRCVSNGAYQTVRIKLGAAIKNQVIEGLAA